MSMPNRWNIYCCYNYINLHTCARGREQARNKIVRMLVERELAIQLEFQLRSQ